MKNVSNTNNIFIRNNKRHLFKNLKFIFYWWRIFQGLQLCWKDAYNIIPIFIFCGMNKFDVLIQSWTYNVASCHIHMIFHCLIWPVGTMASQHQAWFYTVEGLVGVYHYFGRSKITPLNMYAHVGLSLIWYFKCELTLPQDFSLPLMAWWVCG